MEFNYSLGNVLRPVAFHSMVKGAAMKNGAEFQESVRRINCLEVEDFKQIFGEDDGAYIWNKFVKELEQDVFELICYLDGMNMQKLYLHLGYKEGDFPKSEYHSLHCVSLPMFAEMTKEEIETVIRVVNEYGG